MAADRALSQRKGRDSLRGSARTGSTGAFSTVEIAAFQIFKPTARAPRPLAKYNLPIAVSSVIDLLTGLIRPRAFNFALE